MTSRLRQNIVFPQNERLFCGKGRKLPQVKKEPQRSPNFLSREYSRSSQPHKLNTLWLSVLESAKWDY